MPESRPNIANASFQPGQVHWSTTSAHFQLTTWAAWNRKSAPVGDAHEGAPPRFVNSIIPVASRREGACHRRGFESRAEHEGPGVRTA